MKIDSIAHFTDEIGAVEISTFREDLALVIRKPYEVFLVTHQGEETTIVIKKMEGL